MKLVSAVIRPCRLSQVQQALAGIGAEWIIVTEVEGFGRQRGHMVLYQGAEYTVDSFPKVRVDAIVSNEMAHDATATLVRAARTDQIGDGKIFVFQLGATTASAARNDASYDQREALIPQEKAV